MLLWAGVQNNGSIKISKLITLVCVYLQGIKGRKGFRVSDDYAARLLSVYTLQTPLVFL